MRFANKTSKPSHPLRAAKAFCPVMPVQWLILMCFKYFMPVTICDKPVSLIPCTIFRSRCSSDFMLLIALDPLSVIGVTEIPSSLSCFRPPPLVNGKKPSLVTALRLMLSSSSTSNLANAAIPASVNPPQSRRSSRRIVRASQIRSRVRSLMPGLASRLNSSSTGSWPIAAKPLRVSEQFLSSSVLRFRQPFSVERPASETRVLLSASVSNAGNCVRCFRSSLETFVVLKFSLRNAGSLLKLAMPAPEIPLPVASTSRTASNPSVNVPSSASAASEIS